MRSTIRGKVSSVAVTAVLALLCVPTTAMSAPVCAGASVTGPSPIGAQATGTNCQPTPLPYTYLYNACFGVPPAGVTVCYTVTAPMP